MAHARRRGREPALLHEMADNFFPLPEVPFGHLKALPEDSRHRVVA